MCLTLLKVKNSLTDTCRCCHKSFNKDSKNFIKSCVIFVTLYTKIVFEDNVNPFGVWPTKLGILAAMINAGRAS